MSTNNKKNRVRPVPQIKIEGREAIMFNPPHTGDTLYGTA